MKGFSKMLQLATILVAGITCDASAAVFTNDTVIPPTDLSYDGLDVVVSNCTLTVDGPHGFAGLMVGGGATLTHSYWPGGSFSNLLTVADEPQTLTDTNIVALLHSNILTGTVRVTDVAATVSYTNELDYVLSDLGGGLTGLQRTTNSTIPDGGAALVSYMSAYK
ncbi:MAG: hypothetical protein MUF81_13780 [Verrucomicrobia bacterium]|jgi:hypothetical protein|nr:hypothetical protein [Verrucomicrobiota bacterium]